MHQLEFLKTIYSLLKNPKQESLNLSMADTHHQDLFSLVIDGVEFGKLTRVFIASKKLAPFEVQLHTHRYPIRLTVIKGNVRHYTAKGVPGKTVETVTLSEFDYKSPLNGGSGLSYCGEKSIIIQEHTIPLGGVISMDETEFHTVSCSKGSMWIVEELGFKTDSSKVLGVPFVTEGLYNAPKPFQVNDHVQLVSRQIKKLILDYEGV